MHIEINTIGNGKIVDSNYLQWMSTKKASTESGLRNIIERYQLVTKKAVLIKKNEISFSVSSPLLPQFKNDTSYTH